MQIPIPTNAKYPYSQVEPSIAINSNNLNELIAGSVMNDYYYSKDGGQNWNSTSLKSKYGVNGDPVLMFDKFGSVYYFHLANYKKTQRLDRIVCQKSKSIEGFWNQGTFPKENGTKVQDKHQVSYNHKKNTFYLTWTQFDGYQSKNPLDSSIILFSKSNNGGNTWTNPKRISNSSGTCLDDDQTVEGAVSSIGINGEIYVIWVKDENIYFQVSYDDGETWLKNERIIQKIYGGWVQEVPGIYRCNGFPSLICDTSQSSNRGRLYLSWTDLRNGAENSDVFLSYSDNSGESWSTVQKVNQDFTKSSQFFSSMAIDQKNGNLYVVYMDRREQIDWNTDIFLSQSTDGGNSFEDIRISQKPFKPNPEIFFGDYLSIAAFNNKIRPIWPRMDERKITLWTAIIDY